MVVWHRRQEDQCHEGGQTFPLCSLKTATMMTNNHDHFDHNPSDHNHSDHDHTHHFDLSKTKDLLVDLQRSLRGLELRIGKRHRVQGESYGYWVDVYVEIDNTLCTNNQET